MGPDVDRLVGHLEAAEDAVQRRALRVPVPRDDAVLPEHLGEEEEGREKGSVQVASMELSDSVRCVFYQASSKNLSHFTAFQNLSMNKSFNIYVFFKQ